MKLSETSRGIIIIKTMYPEINACFLWRPNKNFFDLSKKAKHLQQTHSILVSLVSVKSIS